VIPQKQHFKGTSKSLFLFRGDKSRMMDARIQELSYHGIWPEPIYQNYYNFEFGRNAKDVF